MATAETDKTGLNYKSALDKRMEELRELAKPKPAQQQPDPKKDHTA